MFILWFRKFVAAILGEENKECYKIHDMTLETDGIYASSSTSRIFAFNSSRHLSLLCSLKNV